MGLKPDTALVGIAGIVTGVLISQCWSKSEMNRMRKELDRQHRADAEMQERLVKERNEYFCTLETVKAPGHRGGYDKAAELCTQPCWRSTYADERVKNVWENAVTPAAIYRKARDACGR